MQVPSAATANNQHKPFRCPEIESGGFDTRKVGTGKKQASKQAKKKTPKKQPISQQAQSIVSQGTVKIYYAVQKHMACMVPFCKEFAN